MELIKLARKYALPICLFVVGAGLLAYAVVAPGAVAASFIGEYIAPVLLGSAVLTWTWTRLGF